MEISQEQSRAFLIIAIVIALFGGYVLYSLEREPSKEIMAPGVRSQQHDHEAEKAREIYMVEPVIVHVCGRVKEPGVYRLPGGSIKVKALEAAGGAADDADLERINLASTLKTGEMVRVPTRSFPHSKNHVLAQSEPGGEHISAGDEGEQVPLDINTAGADALDRLPGIGPAMAKRIIHYREQHGRFQDIEELKKIPGLKKKTFEGIKNKISLQ